MGFWDILRRKHKGTEAAVESTAAAGSATAKSAATKTAAAAGGAVAAGTTAAGGAVAAGTTAAVEEQLASKLLGETGDKLSAVLEKLRGADLDDVVKSWIAKDKNKPVSADQVKAALGDDEVKSVATEMGISSDQAAGTIAKILPTLIDKLTPDGLVPDPEALAKKLTGLFKK